MLPCTLPLEWHFLTPLAYRDVSIRSVMPSVIPSSLIKTVLRPARRNQREWLGIGIGNCAADGEQLDELSQRVADTSQRAANERRTKLARNSGPASMTSHGAIAAKAATLSG